MYRNGASLHAALHAAARGKPGLLEQEMHPASGGGRGEFEPLNCPASSQNFGACTKFDPEALDRTEEHGMTDRHADRLAARYRRIYDQLQELFAKNDDPIARMATVAALLHHKMPHYFWTGFYRLQGDRLIVGPYQGPVACAILPGPEGVCWEAVNRGESVLVPDVHAFPGHVACDPRSQSEIVVPVLDAANGIVGVVDVDSRAADAFGPIDRQGLERIAGLIHAES
jgi:GAF domain-containing protein